MRKLFDSNEKSYRGNVFDTGVTVAELDFDSMSSRCAERSGTSCAESSLGESDL